MAPRYVSLATVIIDDIVLPTGETRMGELGGAGTHAIAGMRVWSAALGMVGAIGADCPPSIRARLAAYGVDLSGLIVRPGLPTARAWQIFEFNDHRTEIFRNSLDTFRAATPRPDEIPADWLQADGWHVQWGTPAGLAVLFARIRAARTGARIFWEPTFSQVDAGLAALRPLCPQVDVFSPNFEEAARLCGTSDLDAIVATLAGTGAPLLALRMGKAGSLVHRHADGRTWRIPAAPAQVVDVTGAGNAYCGGFVVGLCETGDPFEAGLRGAVSASFAVEQFGPAPVERFAPDEIARRLEWTRGEAR
ncbi:MAG: hypothetical protein HZB53_15545 [Chloroflexi bacterium]|nr:hypothetical protein [Chloroflexota bacterium]